MLLLLLKIGVLLVYAVPEAAFVLAARVTTSMQPARLSEILGSVKMLADEVRKLPGRRLLSIEVFETSKQIMSELA